MAALQAQGADAKDAKLVFNLIMESDVLEDGYRQETLGLFFGFPPASLTFLETVLLQTNLTPENRTGRLPLDQGRQSPRRSVALDCRNFVSVSAACWADEDGRRSRPFAVVYLLVQVAKVRAEAGERQQVPQELLQMHEFKLRRKEAPGAQRGQPQLCRSHI